MEYTLIAVAAWGIQVVVVGIQAAVVDNLVVEVDNLVVADILAVVRVPAGNVPQCIAGLYPDLFILRYGQAAGCAEAKGKVG